MWNKNMFLFVLFCSINLLFLKDQFTDDWYSASTRWPAALHLDSWDDNELCGRLLLLPAQQDVVVLMSDDCSCPPSYRALLTRLQAVLTQLHSVVVAVTVGWQMTQCFHRGIRSSVDFSACCVRRCDQTDAGLQMFSSAVEVIHGCVGDQTTFNWLFEIFL